MSAEASLHLSQNAEADALLSRDAFALLVGMLLDQQVPMEKAFVGPYVILSRLGGAEDAPLDPTLVASQDPDAFAALCAQPPAVHRFPGAMAARVQALAAAVVEQYGGDAEAIWRTASDGIELRDRLQALPGFGKDKARIFLALLGKRLGVTPPGWREAAEPYGVEGIHRSVADVTGPDTLAAVRADKKERKAAAKTAGSTSPAPAGSRVRTRSSKNPVTTQPVERQLATRATSGGDR